MPALVRLLSKIPIPAGVWRPLTRTPRIKGIGDVPSQIERARVAGALGGASITALLAAGRGLLALAAPAVVGALCLLAFDRWLVSSATERRRGILRELPDVLDMIAVAMAAGVGIGPAFRLAADASAGAMAEELSRAEGELRLGMSRRQALSALADRIGLPEVQRSVRAVRDGEELGVPLSDVLADQAREIRIAQREEVRTRAATAAPKIQLVVALTMVPAAMMLVLGVLVLNLASQVGAALG